MEDLNKLDQNSSVDIRITDVDLNEGQINDFLNLIESKNLNVNYDFRGAAKLANQITLRKFSSSDTQEANDAQTGSEATD